MNLNQERRSFSYLKILSTTFLGVQAILLTFVVPVFAKMFATSGVALPVPTQWLLAVSRFWPHVSFLWVVNTFLLYKYPAYSRKMVLLTQTLFFFLWLVIDVVSLAVPFLIITGNYL